CCENKRDNSCQCDQGTSLENPEGGNVEEETIGDTDHGTNRQAEHEGQPEPPIEGRAKAKEQHARQVGWQRAIKRVIATAPDFAAEPVPVEIAGLAQV